MSDRGFAGRVAVVTGGASGVGRAVAGRLAGEGAKVAILDVDEARGKGVAAELGATFLPCDVGCRDAWRAAAERIAADLGLVGLLSLNAGIMTRPPDAPLGDDPFDWIAKGGYARVFRVNVDGVVFGLEAMRSSLEKAPVASVVVTASTAGLSGVPFDPFYSMTKHAVVGLVRSLASPFASRGIVLNALCPGGVDTPLLPTEARALGTVLLAPAEVADAVCDLLGRETAGGIWVKSRAGVPAELHTTPEASPA